MHQGDEPNSPGQLQRYLGSVSGATGERLPSGGCLPPDHLPGCRPPEVHLHVAQVLERPQQQEALLLELRLHLAESMCEINLSVYDYMYQYISIYLSSYIFLSIYLSN